MKLSLILQQDYTFKWDLLFCHIWVKFLNLREVSIFIVKSFDFYLTLTKDTTSKCSIFALSYPNTQPAGGGMWPYLNSRSNVKVILTVHML